MGILKRCQRYLATISDLFFSRVSLLLYVEFLKIRKRESMAGLRPKELARVGYPYLSTLAEAFRNSPANEEKIALIGPTWGAGSSLRNPGLLLEAVNLLSLGGFTVYLRPHPMSLVRREDKLALEDLKRRAGDRLRWNLDHQNDLFVLRAELLLGDWSGLLMEYAFVTGKLPVVYLKEGKIRNPAWADLGLPLVENRFVEEFCLPAEEMLRAGPLDRFLEKKKAREREMKSALERFREEIAMPDEASLQAWSRQLARLS
jgi:hypothetical protein